MLIFAKWIWLSIPIIVILSYTIFHRADSLQLNKGYWNQHIGGTLVKKRIYIIIPFFIISVLIVIRIPSIVDVLLVIVSCIWGVLIFLILISYIYSNVLSKNTLSEINWGGWISLISFIYLFIIMIPFTTGLLFANKTSNEKQVFVKFNQYEYLNSKDSIDLFYIGKTKDYFFINNKRTNTTRAYKIDNIEYIEFIK